MNKVILPPPMAQAGIPLSYQNGLYQQQPQVHEVNGSALPLQNR